MTRAERFTALAEAAGTGRWHLSYCRLPVACLIGTTLTEAEDGLVRADLTIEKGKIVKLESPKGNSGVDLGGRIVLPGLVDCHTHLDKGHIWSRTPNPDGTFAGAIDATWTDRQAHWTLEDIRQRMEFGLRAAYAHGTVAMRTHLDMGGESGANILSLVREIAEEWAGRITLQPAPLLGSYNADDPELLERIARELKPFPGAALGAFARAFREDQPDLPKRLEGFIRTAEKHGLALDFHVDETTDPSSRGFAIVAEAVRQTGFEGPVLCGHCCALSGYTTNGLRRVLEMAQGTGISVVSLPLCNAYLLDRHNEKTPRLRAVAPVHEIRAAGMKVAFGSDNTRDPFNAYGDLDLWEIYRFATLMQHLDHPVGDWPASVSRIPAEIIGVEAGCIAPGASADLIVLNARAWDEAISRPQSDRIVIRDGLPIDPPLPEYAELDGLEGLDELPD
ncbi:MAG: cytosine deaminase [Pseudomonadota bacterium]